MNNSTTETTISDFDFGFSLTGVDWQEMKQSVAEDNFDNGRTPEQLKLSFENSYRCCIVKAEGRIIGTARILSDGVCNAYLVDVWTMTKYRHRGIATRMIDLLTDQIYGQHVGLFALNELAPFYNKNGFAIIRPGFMKIVGTWLGNKPIAETPQV